MSDLRDEVRAIIGDQHPVFWFYRGDVRAGLQIGTTAVIFDMKNPPPAPEAAERLLAARALLE